MTAAAVEVAAPPLWMPTRFTPTLTGTEEFCTDGDWLLKMVDLCWRMPDGSRVVLDDWQRWLVRHVLETFPPGHSRAGQLRFGRVVVSMARQNGKSLLGAILALYGLIRQSGSLVIGIASSADQARIVYDRLRLALTTDPRFRKRFRRVTGTRGITSTDNSVYEMKAAKSDAVQGLPVDVGLVDELHIVDHALWTDMVNGTTATRGIVVGITTAGDDSSALLKDLYAKIEEGAGERFGHFVWEAPEATVPKDDDLLAEYLLAANPALAAGRLDLSEAIESVRSMPAVDAIRYRLNRFVSSSSGFLSLDVWSRCTGALADPRQVVIAIDRTPDWSAASIVAAWKDDEGKTYTKVLASLVRPTIDVLEAECVALSKRTGGKRPVLFVNDGQALKGLMERLKAKGLPVKTAGLGDVMSASSLFYGKVVQRRLVHPGEAVLARQVPKVVRKNVGEQYKLTRQAGADIDAVMATVLAVYFAETHKPVGMQLFTAAPRP